MEQKWNDHIMNMSADGWCHLAPLTSHRCDYFVLDLCCLKWSCHISNTHFAFSSSKFQGFADFDSSVALYRSILGANTPTHLPLAKPPIRFLLFFLFPFPSQTNYFCSFWTSRLFWHSSHNGEHTLCESGQSICSLFAFIEMVGITLRGRAYCKSSLFWKLLCK